ncbi:heterokaryon incompatibility protein-domain-containing protein, partial [Stachybotrys elegans]
LPWNDNPPDNAGSKPVERDGYLPLTRPQDIRVLVLHPGKRGSRIECSLTTHDLSQNPRFEALSYVWGQTVPSHDIVCNKTTRTIGNNLFHALDRLRLPDKDRYLWVDALCINQADNGEKTHQVRMMGDIYSRARRVLIWLGGDDAIQRGIETIASHVDEQDVNWSPLQPLFTHPLFYLSQRLLVWLGFHGAAELGVNNLKTPQSSAPFDWALVVPVIQSPWFTRVWCIQELVMASNPILVSRDSTLTWNSFSKTVLAFRQQFKAYQKDQSFENFYLLNDIRQRFKKKTKASLLELMFLTRGFQATDPRDKLFALVGLAGDVLSSDWEVTPNYNLSVLEVYRQFALWHLTRKRQLGILSFGRNHDLASLPALEGLPSWVPDLTRPGSAAPLPKLDYLSVNYIDVRYDLLKEFELRRKHFGLGTKVYHADLKYSWWSLGRRAKFQPPRIAFSHGTAVIHVTGTKIGSLKMLGTPFGHSASALDTYKWLGEGWDIANGNLPQAFNSVLRTMICCMTSEGDNVAFPIYQRAARSIYDKYASKALPDFTEYQWASLLLLHDSIAKWQQGRRFAVMEGTFAAVPTAAKQGDIICIFDGGRVPFVLRPRGNGHFSLIGECYVDGMMRGEVWD